MSSVPDRKPLLSPADRRRHNREEVINAILETSRVIIREHGAAGLNLNEVARQLNMKPPSLYEYFPSKMAIYDALFQQGIGLFRLRMEQNPRETVSLWDRVRLTMETYLTFASENPELYQIIFERPIPGFIPSEEGMRKCMAALAYLNDGLSQAMEAGTIKTDVTLEQAYSLVGALMHGLTALHIANEPQLPVGSGRFGSLIPAAVAVLRAAWEPEQSDKKHHSRIPNDRKGERRQTMSEAYHHRLTISYDDAGQGEPALLFLPGWCASRAAWSDLIPKSATHRRILSLDWQGHGRSESPLTDFGEQDLVEDALCVIKASGVRQVIPVALAHAGWVAIELRRRLGDQIPKVILIDWIILEAPAPFLGALQALQDPTQWQQTRDHLFSMWLEGIDNSALINFVQQDMGAHGAEMWGRAGREISSAYGRAGSPLNALAALNPPVSVLHLYAQPADQAFLNVQQSFAASHPWFHVQRLQARSHFPMFEVPDAMASAIETFVTG